MGAQDERWTSKQRLARSAVLLTGLTVTITLYNNPYNYNPEGRVKIGSYTSDNGLPRATRYFAVPKATARRLKLGSHFVILSLQLKVRQI